MVFSLQALLLQLRTNIVFFPSVTKTVFINVMMALLFYGAHYAVFRFQMSSRSINLSRDLLSVPLCLEK